MKHRLIRNAPAVVVLLGTSLWAQEPTQDAGRKCRSADAAAVDAMRTLIELSRSVNGTSDPEEALDPYEFGSYVFQRPDGSFGWTVPTGSPPDERSPRWRFQAREIQPDGSSRLATGERIAGVAHSHPPSEHLQFSTEDLNLADRNGFDIYVVGDTPSSRGGMLVYQHGSREMFPDLPSGVWGSLSDSLAAECKDHVEGDVRPASDPQPDPDPSRPPPLPAGVVGDPHLLLHNGTRHSFQAAGEFTAVEADDGSLSLQVRFEPAGRRGAASVMTAAALRVGGQTIGFYAAEPRVRLSGRSAAEAGPPSGASGHLAIPGMGALTWNHREARVQTELGDYLRVLFPAGGGRIDLFVGLAASRRGRTHGLLGALGGTGGTLEARSGAAIDLEGLEDSEFFQRLYRDWGDSWRIQPRDSIFEYRPGESAETYDRRDYPGEKVRIATVLAQANAARARADAMRAGVPQGALLEMCLHDVLLTDDPTFAAAYADLALAHRGLHAPDRFQYPHLAVASPWLLSRESARWTEDRVRLTGPGVEHGLLLYAGPVRVDRDFECEFTFSMSGQNGGRDPDGGGLGGEGLMLIITGSPLRSGDPGAGLVGLSTRYRDDLLVLELDTFQDRIHADPSGNHVSLKTIRGGDRPEIRHEDTSLQTSSGIPELSDGRRHTARLVCDADRMRVYLDGSPQPALNLPARLDSLVRLDAGRAYLALMGWTGASRQIQDVHAWRAGPREP